MHAYMCACVAQQHEEASEEEEDQASTEGIDGFKPEADAELAKFLTDVFLAYNP